MRKERKGVHVYEVNAYTGVDTSQLRTGDIIVGLADRAIGSVDDLHLALNEERIGQRCEVRVLRGGHTETLFVVPGELK